MLLIQTYQGKPIRSSRKYSDDVGKVLATVKGPNPTYQVTGKQLNVRAVVTSDQPHADPASFLIANSQGHGYNLGLVNRKPDQLHNHSKGKTR